MEKRVYVCDTCCRAILGDNLRWLTENYASYIRTCVDKFNPKNLRFAEGEYLEFCPLRCECCNGERLGFRYIFYRKEENDND